MHHRHILAGLLLAACGRTDEHLAPQVGPITESVYASGVVKARDQYNVFASVTGILAQALVQEGDTVHADAPLFVIDDRASTLNSQNAELALELTAKNAAERSPILKERELAVQLAREKLTNDSLLYARQKVLWDQQIGSRLEFEQRELAFSTSRSNYVNALAALEDTRSRLRNELEIARNNLARSQVGRGDHTVRSLVDGRVYDVLIEKGELVTPQMPLAVVGRSDAFVLELQVDEFDIARVHPGQRALLAMDSYKGQLLEAEVTRVDPILDRRSRTFTVEATFTDPPGQLYPYLTAEANIVVQHKDRALTIPANYLVEDRYVLTGKDERREVTVGLRDLQRVEILAGIDSTTVIYKP